MNKFYWVSLYDLNTIDYTINIRNIIGIILIKNR